MSISYQDALTQLDALTANGRIATQQELRSLASSVSVYAQGSVTVLYGGDLASSVSAGSVVTQMAANDSSLRVISNTGAASLLQDFRFQQAIADSFGVSTDQVGIRGNPANLFLEGTDGLWGDTSVRFIQETTGEVRILTESPNPTRILYARELPALVERLQDNSITAIDGISRDDLLKIAAPASLNDIEKAAVLRNSILTNAITQTHFTKPALGNFGNWLHLAPDGLTGILNNISAAEHKAWQDLLSPFEVPRVATRAFSKLGVIGGVVTFGLMSIQASAAELKGDHEGAKQIVTEWGLDIAGSTAGQAIGAAAGAAALTALAAVGVVFTAPVAGALVVGAALIGGLFGADAALGIYALTKDADNNGKLDLFDRLTTLLFGENYTITTPLPATLDGKPITLDASISREEMVAAAKTDIAWRYALRELNAFVIPNIDYSQHNTDGSLDLYDPVTGHGVMTDLYLADRAAMLAWKIRYDKGDRDDNDLLSSGPKPYSDQWDTSSISGDWNFVDLATQVNGSPLSLFIDGKGSSIFTADPDHQIVFGSNSADTLTGGEVTDHLYGMAGTDTLTGNAGSDYLEGGAGTDTYQFAAGDGYDTVLDSDGQGVIKIGAIEAKGSTGLAPEKWSKLSDNAWADTLNGITYTRSVINGETQLLIHKGDNNVVVKGWVEGELGIALGAGTPPERTPLVGQDAYSDALFGTGGADLIQGLTGNDALDGSGGDDLIDGGLGDDLIAGGAGRDILHGGAGRDMILSATGLNLSQQQDHDHDGNLDPWAPPADAGAVWTQGRLWGIYADADDPSIEIIDGGGALLPDSAPDFVFGEDGDDKVVGGLGDDYLDGGKDNDKLWGHGGNDVLVGGDGVDSLNGDGILKPGFYQSLDPTLHGDDVLDGGAGADSMMGGGKDDALFGGAGDDKLWGDDQSEAELGGQYHGGDVLDGGDGADQLIGGGGDDSLYGGAGADLLWGDDDDETKLSGQYHGTDTLDGGAGQDQLIGGGGDDALSGGADNDVLYGDARAGTVLAAQYEGADILDGGDGDDHLYGGGGNDTLVGGLGNDFLDGGLGADFMTGGAGDDSYVVDDANDQVIEQAGEGTDKLLFAAYAGAQPAGARAGLAQAAALPTGQALPDNLILPDNIEHFSLTGAGAGLAQAAALPTGLAAPDNLILPDNIEHLSLTGAGAVDGTGNDADNSLWGNAASNTLGGGLGTDFLMGNAGDDVYAFNRGDGQDAIDNTDFLRDTANPGLIGAIDTLRFGAGIAETDVLGFQVNNDLVLKLKSTSEQVALIDYYGADTLDGSRVSDHKIDRVEFADGAVWDQAMIQTVVDRAANNQAPTVHTFLPALQAHAGAVFSYEIPADAIVDPDAWDSITYKVEMPDGSALPGWLGFDAATRTLSGTPSSGGTISVKVTAKDAGEGNDVMRDGAGTAAPRRRRITERHSTTRSNAYNFRQIERMKRAA